MVTWQDRKREWVALDEYVREHEEELVTSGRMRGMTMCMQRTWQDMMRLRKERVDGDSKAGDTSGASEVLEVHADDACGDHCCQGPKARGGQEQ